jgi:glycosyltransferase involved in cell wall biosynthesis
MRIVIDMQGAQSSGSRRRGVGRYTLEMTKAFVLEANQNHEIFLALNGTFSDTIEEIRKQFKGYIPRTNIKCWQQYANPVAGIGGNDWRRSSAELIREWYLNQLNADIIWSTNLQEGWIDNAVSSTKLMGGNEFIVSTLHDVIPMLFPEKYLSSSIKNWYEDKIKHAKNSDLILTASEYSKKQICRLLEIEESKVFVAPNAYDKDIFRKRIDSNVEQHDLHNNLKLQSYIFYAGGVDEHKNLNCLLRAFALLPIVLKMKYCIVIAGNDAQAVEPQIKFLASKVGIDASQLFFTGFVSDLELANLYRNCTTFVYPSYSEGFGLPVLEAMASGCPVLAGNAASIPEIINFNQALFDPFNEVDIASKIEAVLTNESLRTSLAEKGLERARDFSWAASAKKILSIFEAVYDKKTSENKKYNSYNTLIDKISRISAEPSSVDLIETAQSIADSLIQPNYHRTCYLDLSCLVHFDHTTGIQRVVRAISNELLKNVDTTYKFSSIFSYSGHNNFYHIARNEDYYGSVNDLDLSKNIVDFNDGDILLFLDLHPGSSITKALQLQKLRNRGVQVYFVVYDLLPISHPQYFVPELSDEFVGWLKVVVQSDGAICISADVENKLDDWIQKNSLIPSADFKIKHFHLGADLHSSVPSKGLSSDAVQFVSKINKKKSFLMVGTVEPRKGHAAVLDAFELLWADGKNYILIIVGKEGWCNEQNVNRLRDHPEFMKRLFWLDCVSDEYLEKIYSNSTCLIAASEGEGFGLPLIEAAKHKLPIIARDIDVFREVAGEYAHYFKNDNSVELAQAFEQWLALYDLGQHPKSEKMPWLTWKESADQLIKALRHPIPIKYPKRVKNILKAASQYKPKK